MKNVRNLPAKLVILSTLLPAAVLSCGKAKDSAGGSLPVPVPPGVPTPNSAAVVATNATDLQGYWVSSCAKPTSGLFALDYARHQVQFKDNRLFVTVASFSTSDCKPESMEKLLLLNGSYELSPGADKSGSNLNYAIDSVHIGALSEQAVGDLNAGKGTCGVKTYDLGGMTDVKDIAGCDYLYTASIKPFTIVGLVDGKLTLGNYYSSEEIGTTAEKRPTTFAVGEELTKTTQPMIEMETN